jgi:4-amino-4-deoxy-L-arabinose transferase-like glycosyltransferase
VIGMIVAWKGRSRRERLLRWALLWVAATVLVFSLVPMKKNAYLLPSMPAQTLLSVAGLLALLRDRKLPERWGSPRAARTLAIALGLVVHIAEVWLVPRADNRRSDAPFAALVRDQARDGQPLYVIGGLREDVLFYLGQPLPRADSLAELPAEYHGLAIVTADHEEAVAQSDRAQQIAISTSERPAKDRLYLFRFPRRAPATLR